MNTRKLGTEGLEVSSVGLGCMGMSDFYGAHNDADSMATLSAAIDSGVTFWDTSDAYGPYTNEQLLGRYFKDNPGARNKVIVATKFGILRNTSGDFNGFDGRPEYLQQACDDSLKRLGVDHIDLYYQHRMDPAVPIEETVGAMAELVTQGKIRYLGLSEASANTLERASKVHPISALQSEYSLWSQHLEESVLPACKKLGIGFVSYSPLGRGFLTGAIKSRDDLEAGDWRLQNPRFSEENFQQNLVLVDRIKEMALEKQCTTAQLALAWILHQGADYVSIPGTRSPTRVQENAKAMEVTLTTEELSQIATNISTDLVFGQRYPEPMMGALEL
ncbi:aldo/keto reductase [Gammaproteobacteria bacterium 45_16_T64]|nr:aldo/keto reductase [Gammaproteobacteria bacterium 45_16_T64]